MLLHALIPLGIALVGGLVVGAVMEIQNTEKFGYGLGRFAGVGCIIACLASYFYQKGMMKAALGLAIGIFVFVLTAAVAIGMFMSHGRMNYIMSPLEKAPLKVLTRDGKPYLSHRAIGFKFLHPGPNFKKSDKAVTAFASKGIKSRGMKIYGYLNQDARAALTVNIQKGLGRTRRSVEQFIKGVKKGMARAAKLRNMTLKFDKVRLDWTPFSKEMSFGIALKDSLVYRFRGLVFTPPPGKIPFVVMLMGASATADMRKRLDKVLASLGKL